ncbi:MAG: hypothetical protein AAFQ89_10880 [Cyanobacteria bacterium J06626_18]
MTDVTLDKAFFYSGLACIGFGLACIGSALLVSQERHFQCSFSASAAQQRFEVIQGLAN